MIKTCDTIKLVIIRRESDFIMDNEVTEVTPEETVTAEAPATEAPAAPVGAGNTPEKLQKVMEYLNSRIAEDKEAITDESALEAIINEPDDDDDDFDSDDSDSFDDEGDDDFEDLGDDDTPDNIVADLGVTNDSVDVDDLEDLF